MCQKLTKKVEEELEELREDVGFYFEKFEKTEAKADKIRFYFSVMRYYALLCQIDNNPQNQLLYQRAKENYDRVVPVGEIYSHHHKT